MLKESEVSSVPPRRRNQDHERIGFGRGPAAGAGGALDVFDRREIGSVSGWIESHGFGSAARLELLNDLEFVGRGFSGDCRRAVAAACEDVAGSRIERAGVVDGADRKIGKN